jgi:hypothetical protein
MLAYRRERRGQQNRAGTVRQLGDFSPMCPPAPSQPLSFSFRHAQDDNHHQSVTIRSAHSSSETKTAGLPNFAPQASRSVSVTPRAREQLPQEKTGMCFAMTFSRSSLRGGQPKGNTAAAVALRMRYVALVLWKSTTVAEYFRVFNSKNYLRCVLLRMQNVPTGFPSTTLG